MNKAVGGLIVLFASLLLWGNRHLLIPARWRGQSEIKVEEVRIPEPREMALSFPKNYVWGVATSAFQSEGGGGRTDWDAFSKYRKSKPYHPGLTFQDIELAKSLGIQEIRISIEWSRIEPHEGEWNLKELDRYYEYALRMDSLGIKPFINLHHFSLPYWVAKKGGLESDEFPELFARYTKHIAERFRPLHIRHWMTFNEPMVLIEMCYIEGLWPPHKKADIVAANKAEWNLIEAHKRAYHEIHASNKTAFKEPMVGMAYFDHLYLPVHENNADDIRVAAYLDRHGKAMMEAVVDTVDYIGINYYNPCFVGRSGNSAPRNAVPVSAYFEKPKTAFSEEGMAIYPEGIRILVKQYARYGKPIIVTENGIGDRKDVLREKFILEHLKELHKAVEELRDTHSPVIGYFYWTLTDCYEWDKFRTSHFGLVSVNRANGAREIRKSAYLYRDIIRANGITEEMLRTRNIK